MGYFDEVYLKRINRYGNTLQERIQNKREHDFEVMMAKSPNKVEVQDSNNMSYEGVLQTKIYDEDETVDYLLLPIEQELSLGTVLWFTDIRHEERDFPFLNYAIDPYTTQGYNRYSVIELEELLYCVKDGEELAIHCHAAGGGSGARDKNINLKFKMQFSESGVYLPNKRYSLVLPLHEIFDKDTGDKKPFLHKNDKVTLGRKYDENGNILIHGETWRITGYDMISVDGVVYMTLEEAQTDTQDDIPVANYKEVEYKKNHVVRAREGETVKYTMLKKDIGSTTTLTPSDTSIAKIISKTEDTKTVTYTIQGLQVGTTTVYKPNAAATDNPLFTIEVVSIWMEG